MNEIVSRREWFAGMAMGQIIDTYIARREPIDQFELAKKAYAIADAMIQESEK